jgi:hypothetical protein
MILMGGGAAVAGFVIEGGRLETGYRLARAFGGTGMRPDLVEI